ncbi:uncharacterized protein SPSK_02884 [Sporothrix schenckii 1099-18]|uniref:Uncharacterized protein n=1 Tax=Sporothrix schenckii 1099-18 TaxID=1397361 RepID=A0A0F2M9H4_SPOSC|nr:uncharacterized protein SPSK_02884 [Sporothrix schenckii 1099-18]KJR86363.1 hypothetical protein SPSK_02884 [Sporothrix schenckii 1099-18]
MSMGQRLVEEGGQVLGPRLEHPLSAQKDEERARLARPAKHGGGGELERDAGEGRFGRISTICRREGVQDAQEASNG